MNIEPGHQTRCVNGPPNKASNWWSAPDRVTLDLQSWNDDTKSPGELWTSSWTRTLPLQQTKMAWWSPSTTLCHNWIEHQCAWVFTTAMGARLHASCPRIVDRGANPLQSCTLGPIRAIHGEVETATGSSQGHCWGRHRPKTEESPPKEVHRTDSDPTTWRPLLLLERHPCGISLQAEMERTRHCHHAWTRQWWPTQWHLLAWTWNSPPSRGSWTRPTCRTPTGCDWEATRPLGQCQASPLEHQEPRSPRTRATTRCLANLRRWQDVDQDSQHPQTEDVCPRANQGCASTSLSRRSSDWCASWKPQPRTPTPIQIENFTMCGLELPPSSWTSRPSTCPTSSTRQPHPFLMMRMNHMMMMTYNPLAPLERLEVEPQPAWILRLHLGLHLTQSLDQWHLTHSRRKLRSLMEWLHLLHQAVKNQNQWKNLLTHKQQNNLHYQFLNTNNNFITHKHLKPLSNSEQEMPVRRPYSSSILLRRPMAHFDQQNHVRLPTPTSPWMMRKWMWPSTWTWSMDFAYLLAGPLRRDTSPWTSPKMNGSWRDTISPGCIIYHDKKDTCLQRRTVLFPNYLMKDRYSKMNNGQLVRDKWTRPTENRKLKNHLWTGYTRFKIHSTWRKMAKQTFSERSNGMETMYYNEETTGQSSPPTGPLNERHLSMADRLTFMEAKKKELDSFFENSVWEIDDEKNADASRILRAKFLLNWKKNPDGTPRPKARLVVQGFRDPDALQGSLATNSPTLTRLSRNYVLAVATMLGMTLFTSDISTAFLQGKNFDPNSNRVIWVRLPRDVEKLLGFEPGQGKLMRLVKPMYGLCDAPRAWYEAATQKILDYGKGKIIQHPLDACLFMVFDRPVHPPPAQDDEEPQLVAMFGIHVDDLFGCHRKDATTFIGGLRKIFTFREWNTGEENKELEYCGAQITEIAENHWRIHHEKYLAKQKPITYPKERHGSNDEVTERERTALRALVGALQWPSTQTSPHLQAMTSTLAGQITKATTNTLDQANKALRYAKENADVGLDFRSLGGPKDITFIAYSDASFASRHDLSSQGGYLVAMVHKDVTSGIEGHYNVVDWRSWKLARVARSTLSAESQAASEAADALLFASTFWNLVWKPWAPLDNLKTARLENSPRLVVDAKALYDLLIKEVQAANNTDKRTAIEVLVTQDKLGCCSAKTMWVSSELQYADGLTKTGAAQLLADRLRSHLTRLKSDENFVASKKKTVKDRKNNTEKYAIQKPSKTQATMMMATFLVNPTEAYELIPYIPDIDTFTFNTHFINGATVELYTTIMPIVYGILLMIGMMTVSRWSFHLILKIIGYMLGRPLWKDGYLKEENTPLCQEEGVQTDEDTLQTFDDLLERNLALEALLEEAETKIRRREEDYERMRSLWQHTRDSVNQDRRRIILEASQQDLYFTRHGRVWHSSYQCVRSRTDGPVFCRSYCTHCVDRLGIHEDDIPNNLRNW